MVEPQSGTVTVYVTQTCPYCHAVKRLLTTLGVGYETVDVSYDPSARRWLAERSGRRTVPQVFVGTRAIGGFDETRAMMQRRSLFELLDAEGVAYIRGGE